MGSEQVEAVQGGALARSGNAPSAASGGGTGEGTAAPDGTRGYRGAIEVRVSYAGECSVEEAVSRYLAARENVRDVIGDYLD